MEDTSISKNAMKMVSNKLGIENVILPFTKYMLKNADKNCVSYGPSEFLDLICNAEFILTDSFHAVCFSLIFEKDFCVLPKHSKSNPFRQNSRKALSKRTIYRLLCLHKCMPQKMHFYDKRQKKTGTIS